MTSDIGTLFPINNALFDINDFQSLPLGFESDLTSLSSFDISDDNNWTTIVDANGVSSIPLPNIEYLNPVGISFPAFEHSSSTPDDSPPTSPSLSSKQFNVISPMEIFGMSEDNVNFPVLEERDSRELSDASPSNSGSSDSSQPSPPTSSSSKRKKGKEDTNSSTRPRKRQRKKEAHVPTSLTIPRARLLTLSWQEFEKWIEEKKIEFGREFTLEEDKDIRRQKRLIKNRESAQYSREKRKNHLTELEAQVKKLVQENGDLNSHIRELTDENLTLKDQVKKFNNLLSHKKNSSSSSAASSGPQISKLLTINKPGIVSQSAGALASAGVCLLMVLLSFGLIFNNVDPTRSIPFKNNNFDIISAGKIIMPPAIEPSTDIPDITGGTGRTLKENQMRNRYSDPPEIPCVDGSQPKVLTDSFEVYPRYNFSISGNSKDTAILIDEDPPNLASTATSYLPAPPNFGLVTGSYNNSV